jgi:hypothetical protein
MSCLGVRAAPTAPTEKRVGGPQLYSLSLATPDSMGVGVAMVGANWLALLLAPTPPPPIGDGCQVAKRSNGWREILERWQAGNQVRQSFYTLRRTNSCATSFAVALVPWCDRS